MKPVGEHQRVDIPHVAEPAQDGLHGSQQQCEKIDVERKTRLIAPLPMATPQRPLPSAHLSAHEHHGQHEIGAALIEVVTRKNKVAVCATGMLCK